MTLLSTAKTVPNDHGYRNPNRLEAAARAEIEQRVERPLTEAEWSAERARFLEFGVILRSWVRTPSGRKRGNVEVLCQQGS